MGSKENMNYGEKIIIKDKKPKVITINFSEGKQLLSTGWNKLSK